MQEAISVTKIFTVEKKKKKFVFEFYVGFRRYFINIILRFPGFIAPNLMCKIPPVRNIIKECIPPGLSCSQHLAVIDAFLPLAVQPSYSLWSKISSSTLPWMTFIRNQGWVPDSRTFRMPGLSKSLIFLIFLSLKKIQIILYQKTFWTFKDLFFLHSLKLCIPRGTSKIIFESYRSVYN